MTYCRTLALLMSLSAVACGGSESDSNQSSAGGTATTSGGSSSSGSGGSAGTGGSNSAGTSAATGGTGVGGSGGVNAGGYGGMQCTPPQCFQICEGGSCSCMCEGTAGSGGVGGAPDCTSLNNTRQQYLDAARVCNAELSGQCTGSATVPNQCACPTLVNDGSPSDVQAAQDAYDAWVAAGCGPYACGAACFEGTTGTCVGQGGPAGLCTWMQ